MNGEVSVLASRGRVGLAARVRPRSFRLRKRLRRIHRSFAKAEASDSRGSDGNPSVAICYIFLKKRLMKSRVNRLRSRRRPARVSGRP